MTTSLPHPTNEASRVKWIQFWLLENTGLAQLHQVADLLGIAPATLANVCRGARRSPEVQALIAETAGRPVEELFGPHTHWSLRPAPQKVRKAG